jgi:hypothetical protein
MQQRRCRCREPALLRPHRGVTSRGLLGPPAEGASVEGARHAPIVLDAGFDSLLTVAMRGTTDWKT